jgi:hypothetical protein
VYQNKNPSLFARDYRYFTGNMDLQEINQKKRPGLDDLGKRSYVSLQKNYLSI